jgi:hypothetical protein
MENQLEKQINEFLEKFSQSSSRAYEDDILFDSGLMQSNSSKINMDCDGIEMTGKIKLMIKTSLPLQ